MEKLIDVLNEYIHDHRMCYVSLNDNTIIGGQRAADLINCLGFLMKSVKVEKITHNKRYDIIVLELNKKSFGEMFDLL